jgi:hypothetical protein
MTYSPTDDPTDAPSMSPIQTLVPTDNPTHVYGAAQVITDFEPKLDALGNSIIPTSSTTRMTEASPDAPVTFCFGGCKGANEICVGNQNNPQTIDDESELFLASTTPLLSFCTQKYELHLVLQLVQAAKMAKPSGLVTLTVCLSPCIKNLVR